MINWYVNDLKYKDLDDANKKLVMATLKEGFNTNLAANILAHAYRNTHAWLNGNARVARAAEYLKHYVPYYTEAEKGRVLPELLYALLNDCGRVSSNDLDFLAVSNTVTCLQGFIASNYLDPVSEAVMQRAMGLIFSKGKEGNVETLIKNVEKAVFSSEMGVRWYSEYLVYCRKPFDIDVWARNVVDTDAFPVSIMAQGNHARQFYSNNVLLVTETFKKFYAQKANNGLALSINLY